MNFEQWLTEMYKKKDGTSLSKCSIEHYKSGLESISKDMYLAGVITKPLYYMDLLELDLAISLIFSNKAFKEKDCAGKRMYSNALKRFRCYLYFNTDLYAKEMDEISSIENNDKLTTEEKKELIESRRGGGQFANALKEKYNNSCVITGVTVSQVLVASHIKPWVVSNNEEKLCIDNGILLSATYERLFESGLISFKKDETVMISSLINEENKEKLNLKDDFIYDIKYTSEMDVYLNYHNDVIYVK